MSVTRDTDGPAEPTLPKIVGMRDLRAPTWAPGARFMLAAVALALFGLLSMHGWGSHAGGHAMAVAPASGAVAMDTAHGHGHVTMTDHGSTTSHARAADGSAPAGMQENPDGEPGTSLMGLCLAVLCGLLLGIALLLARRGIRVPRGLLHTWPHAVCVGGDRDPPDLLQLCVIRC